MTHYTSQGIVDLYKRCELIRAIPCFSQLTTPLIEKMALLMQEVQYPFGANLVKESDIVDSVYILVTGLAEVTHEFERKKKIVKIPLALLHPGETIGLSDTGFYSTTGRRTATVTALSHVVALRLDVKDLHRFLQDNNLELSMYAAAEQMLRMQIIKQSLPFSKLSHERLQWLADHVEEETISAGQVIFNQGDQGDKCYLIRSGQIEIVVVDELGAEKRIALLKPPVLFGEATLITHSPRNAMARAVENTCLLTLKHEYLSELLETESNVAKVFMNLTVDRSRPQQNEHVSVHKRLSAEGEELTILKNPDNGNYFKLSNEGAFIWEQLDGRHTLQEITLALADKMNVFAPDVVVALISKLTQAGFISNLELHTKEIHCKRSLWRDVFAHLRRLVEIRFAFGDSDTWVTTVFQKYIRYLFTKPAQIILGCLILLGLVAFVNVTENVLLFFYYKHASLLLLFILIPLSAIELILHELGHAFAVKAFGREVHYIGIGWYWFAPVAFTDTSDMWLATRKPRIFVNLAGVYVDLLLAGLSSIGVFFIENPYIECLLWIFALYTYLGALRMLSPLAEYDGYYALMDYVEKTRLRQSAVVWLLKDFPKALRHPKLFAQHWPEVVYWVCCVFYILLVSIVALVVQIFIFFVFGIEPPHFIYTLIVPVLVILISIINIVNDLRKAEE